MTLYEWTTLCCFLSFLEFEFVYVKTLNVFVLKRNEVA